jgi:hypothetical protein
VQFSAAHVTSAFTSADEDFQATERLFTLVDRGSAAHSLGARDRRQGVELPQDVHDVIQTFAGLSSRQQNQSTQNCATCRQRVAIKKS